MYEKDYQGELLLVEKKRSTLHQRGPNELHRRARTYVGCVRALVFDRHIPTLLRRLLSHGAEDKKGSSTVSENGLYDLHYFAWTDVGSLCSLLAHDCQMLQVKIELQDRLKNDEMHVGC